MALHAGRTGRLAGAAEAAERLGAARRGQEPPGEALSGALQAAVAAPLWQELEAGLRERLAALTLESLLSRAQAVGLKHPATEPLDFAL